MSALLLHVTAVERLAAQVSTVAPEFSKALGEDLEYARFGAALPELPALGGWAHGVGSWFGGGERPRFARRLLEHAPVGFGLKAAELVANGALVGTEAGLAFVAGYFTQLCVRRSLEPLVATVMPRARKPNESDGAFRARLEWSWSLSLLQELHGTTMVGTPAVRTKLLVRKEAGPWGIGRGFYELIRVSSQEALGEAPQKADVDSWMRGLYLAALALGSPLGRLKLLGSAIEGQQELFRGPGVDVWRAVEDGLTHTREVLTVLGGLIRRGSFSARSRGKVLAVCPEAGAPRAA
ncbi:MAG: hypothetical protein K1X89_06010 [Myxococcaceae bacterium]|nr:hypothetical protein [Myxococcaceae bacterium]